MINVAICDDDSTFTDYLSHLVSMYNRIEFNIFIYNNPYELLEKIESKEIEFTLFLLDIDMPLMDGLDLADNINKLMEEPYFIFISGFDRALDAFRVKALDYITKPIDENKLFNSFERFIYEIEKKEALEISKHKFFIHDDKSQCFKIDYNNILYFERVINKIIVHYIENEKVNTICFSYTLKGIENKLEMEYFFRCHKSYLINRSYINHVKNKKIIIKPYNLEIDVSRKIIEEVREIIKNKLFEVEHHV